MQEIIDMHIHVGHRFEWTERAQALWMDTGPYVPRLFDREQRQLPQEYGDVIKEEGVVAGILIPEYSPGTAGSCPLSGRMKSMPFTPNWSPSPISIPGTRPTPWPPLKSSSARGHGASRSTRLTGCSFRTIPSSTPSMSGARKRDSRSLSRRDKPLQRGEDEVCRPLHL